MCKLLSASRLPPPRPPRRVPSNVSRRPQKENKQTHAHPHARTCPAYRRHDRLTNYQASGIAAIRNLLRVSPESVAAEVIGRAGPEALAELRNLVGAPGEPWSAAAARAAAAATDSLDAMRLQVRWKIRGRNNRTIENLDGSHAD